MSEYRLFLMRDGHVRSAREFTADTDQDAVDAAERLRAGEPAELWSGSRIVRKFHVKQDA